jgi:hypothetical protein
MRKLTRSQIREGLDTIPIETLLSGGPGKEPRLTTKQREFARQVALGQSKAEAYRQSHRRDVTKRTLKSEPYMLASNPTIAREIQAYSLALEAEKHRTPGQIKALLVQQLVQHSLDADFPPAQRVQCLKLLGSLFEVQAFTEHKTVETVKSSHDIRARLIETLADVTDVETDDVAQLLAEIRQPGDHQGSDQDDYQVADDVSQEVDTNNPRAQD